jgi:tripartite-type tricarboxylate transporter receptor subunit TctC
MLQKNNMNRGLGLTKRSLATALSLMLLGTALSVDVLAQTWPSKPIKVVVNFPPGGAADQIARAVGIPLAEALGQPVVIENRGGANGNLGGDIVAKSAPDGYTFLMSSGGMVSVNPHIYARMSFRSHQRFGASGLCCQGVGFFGGQAQFAC